VYANIIRTFVRLTVQIEMTLPPMTPSLALG
jgi:hypothetical protein